MKKMGLTLGKQAISGIIKKAGYRWLKAKKVSPDYRAKLDNIQRILGDLATNEGFFSIDEYGPFAVKRRQGRQLGAPGEVATVPEWQKSKGVLIMTAALELSTNQVTHFYSEKKNTDEMIKLLDLILEQNRHLSRIYPSRDAASWHISKRLSERIASNNVMAHVTGSTSVELAPLPETLISGENGSGHAQVVNVVGFNAAVGTREAVPIDDTGPHRRLPAKGVIKYMLLCPRLAGRTFSSAAKRRARSCSSGLSRSGASKGMLSARSSLTCASELSSSARRCAAGTSAPPNLKLLSGELFADRRWHHQRAKAL